MFKAHISRWSSSTIFGGIVLAFLLPFATVSCGNEEVTFTGVELALRQVPDQTAPTAQSGDESLPAMIEEESGGPALIAFAAAIAGLVLALAHRRGGGFAAVIGLSAILLLAWDLVTTLADVEIHYGYVLAMVGFLAAATYHGIDARRRDPAADDEAVASKPRARRSLIVGVLMLIAVVSVAGCGALLGGAEAEPEYVNFDTADRDPAWAPDGREIAFAREGSVYTVKPDGSCARRVTQGGEPAWSPDGMRLAVTRCDDETCSVTLVSRDGSSERELVVGPFSAPSWSAAGSHVYLSRAEEDLTTTTWVVGVDGSGLRRLARPWVQPNDARWSIGAASEQTPTFSPDGGSYAFGSFDDPVVGIDELEEAIFVRDLPGTERRQLSDPPSNAGDYEPAWSPDGTRISFQRSGEIAVMDADGSNERVLTNVDGATSSAWSPDSREVVFTRELYGGGGYFSDPSALMVVDVESRRVRKLTWGPEPLVPCARPAG
jgi:Tol biopolymer transport system component